MTRIPIYIECDVINAYIQGEYRPAAADVLIFYRGSLLADTPITAMVPLTATFPANLNRIFHREIIRVAVERGFHFLISHRSGDRERTINHTENRNRKCSYAVLSVQIVDIR
jgi:hypothetical protein